MRCTPLYILGAIREFPLQLRLNGDGKRQQFLWRSPRRMDELLRIVSVGLPTSFDGVKVKRSHP